MRIEIDALAIYDALTREPPLSPQDTYILEAARQLREGEKWKGERREEQPFKAQCFLSDTLLLAPFKEITGSESSLERMGNHYNSRLILGISVGNFRELIKGFSEKIAETYKDQWVPSGNRESGYLHSNGEIDISLMDEKHRLIISTGQAGARQREFGDFEKFSGDMIELERFTNTILTAGYEVVRKNGGINSIPPQLKVRIGPR